MTKNQKIINSIIMFVFIIGGIIYPVYAKSMADEAAELRQTTEHQADELHCLAQNLYYEARGSNLADKIAVTDVVMNRVIDRRYPDTICGVVQDGYIAGSRTCQFSWYCDGKSDVPLDMDRWYEAQAIAYSMSEFGQYRGITEGATHYHATYVDPFWADSLQMVGRIGAHIYYRWEEK
jgi:spore germination cell wall hydrolase CwlJ-like protein